MRCRYRSLQSDSSLRCCGFIKPPASSPAAHAELSNSSSARWIPASGTWLSPDTVAAMTATGRQFQYRDTRMHPFTRDFATVVNCHLARGLSLNSISSTMSSRVKLRGGPAVRQGNYKGQVSVTVVITKPDSNGSILSTADIACSGALRAQQLGNRAAHSAGAIASLQWASRPCRRNSMACACWPGPSPGGSPSEGPGTEMSLVVA